MSQYLALVKMFINCDECYETSKAEHGFTVICGVIYENVVTSCVTNLHNHRSDSLTSSRVAGRFFKVPNNISLDICLAYLFLLTYM